MTIRRVSTLVVLALTAGLFVSPASADDLPPPPPPTAAGCTDTVDEALPVDFLTDHGTGHYALPEDDPVNLAVYGHGYGHDSTSWLEHLKRTAGRGAAAVAMDYRGTVVNEQGVKHGWPVKAGAEDLIAAARALAGRCPSIENIFLLGVSMGGNMSGYALTLDAKKPGTDEPLFDYWVAVEAVSNLTEEYLIARAVAPVNATGARAQSDMEAETGGPIEAVPAAYLERTVTARVPDIIGGGLKGAVVVHGIDDGLVPYNQSRELAAAFAAGGLPVDMITALGPGEGADGTTGSEILLGPVFGAAGQTYKSPLAGHGTESDYDHVVIRAGFEALWSLMEGAVPGPYREFVVDGSAGTLPAYPTASGAQPHAPAL